MSRIRVLSDDIANRIAAGEVVERPASVVKEFVENALDAGAGRISVEVSSGGRELIRVTDDGEGMSPEDARACLGRHATSKLYEPDDLFEIRTLGFRGEALPSIASVSRLTVETQAESGPGVKIDVEGGRVIRESETALPRGTRMTVRDLFFNVPARRKFLRSESHELSQITSCCTHYALSFPGVQFQLRSGTFEILSATPVRSYRERLFQVFGADLLEDLVEFEKDAGRSGVKIHLFASRPHVQKNNRSSMFFFINRRLVRDRIILHAISEAYRNILPSRAFPVVILFLSVPFADVDVNVHPAKTEVRFKHQSHIHDLIRDSILEALTIDKSVVPMEDGRSPAPAFGLQVPSRIPDSWNEGPIARAPFDWSSAPPPALAEPIPMRLPLSFRTETGGTCGEAVELPAPPDFEQIRSEIRVLGQIRDSFIVGADATGLVLIDQHVAHERVLFEAYVRDRMEGHLEVQRLLIPIVIELSPRQLVILDNASRELERHGFEVESFGPKSVAVRTVPAVFKSGAVEKLLLELLDGLDREDVGVDLDALKRKIAATVSCHAAVKINMPLDEAKMKWLVSELMKTDVPTVCPHGRPIILRYDLREILRGFKRV